MNISSNTLEKIFLSTESAANQNILLELPSGPAHAPRFNNRDIQRAVYAYIRAVRALGRTRLNTAEIADGLGIPTDWVNRAVTSLRRRGVRTLHG